MSTSVETLQFKKKVIILIDNLGSGGAQKQVFLLSKHLLRENINFKIVTYHQYSQDFYSNELIEMGVKVEQYHLPSYYKRIWFIRSQINQDQPDIVLSLLYGANILACLIKLSSCRKFSLVVSDRTGLTDDISLKDRVRYQLYRVADKIVANSTDTAKKIKERAPFLKQKVTVIWNILDNAALHFKTSNTTKTDTSCLHILIGASYQRLKNPHKFLHGLATAIRKYDIPKNMIRVDWFGNKLLPNNEAYISQLNSIINKFNLQNTVHLNDATKKIQARIVEADFCALPSFFEGCPNFIIEAMYHSKPVILSDVCSNRDIVDENIGGFFFNPHDEESIADAIYHAYNTSQDERKKMGEYNHQKALSMFSPDKNIMEYYKVFGL
jgi:glycosyltransferase involved in cell wall biosynthesis